MACGYQIDFKKKIITHWFRGDVRIQDFECEYLRRFSDPDYHPSYNILIDLREYTFKSDLNEIKRIIELIKKNPEAYGTKHAIWVDSPNETGMAMVRYYQLCARPFRHVRIFSTFESAMAWLDV